MMCRMSIKSKTSKRSGGDTWAPEVGIVRFRVRRLSLRWGLPRKQRVLSARRPIKSASPPARKLLGFRSVMVRLLPLQRAAC
jgi:hypothetical protein